MSDQQFSAHNLAELHTHRSEKWRGFPQDVLPLPVAEMDFPVAEPIKAILTEMVAHSDLGYLGPIPELGLGFKKFAAERWNWTVDEKQVRAATDVGVAVVEILRVFTQPGDSILISSPVYHNFYTWINETKLTLVDAPFERTGDEATNPWVINWDSIEKAYASGIKVHLLCSPHNPLGFIYTKQDLLKIVALAKKHNVLVISDEIHAPLTFPGETFVPILTLGADAESVAICVTAASKGWNIAGLKCAIIVSASDAMHERLNALPPSLHFRASLFGAFATAVAFDKCVPWLDAVIEQLDHNRHLISKLLTEHLPEIAYNPPQHSYLAWLDLSALNLGDEPTAVILEKSNVAFNAGHIYGAQWGQFARMNFATSPEIITQAITQMARGIRG